MSHQPEGVAANRLLVGDAFTIDDFATAAQLAGDPRVVDTPVMTFHDAEIGLWQVDVGTVTEVEIDEAFLVLSGSGQVAFSDGSVLQLRPGALVQLVAGDQTTWVIDQPLRKLYVAWPTPSLPSRRLGEI